MKRRATDFRRLSEQANLGKKRERKLQNRLTAVGSVIIIQL